MRRISPVLLLLAAGVAAQAQMATGVAAQAQGAPESSEGSLASDFRREGGQFHDDCFSANKKILSCLQDLVTGKPLHLTGASIAPQNGFAFGPAFGWEHNLNETWRSATNLEAMAAPNGSWLAGFNFRAIRVSNDPSKLAPIFHRPAKGTGRKIELEHDPELNFYAEAISLNKLNYYGLGPFTARPSLAFYGMREIVVGGTAVYPLKNSGLSLFGEVNGRWFSLRGRHGDTSPSIEQLYTNVTAPGLSQPTGFFQPSGGIRFDRDLSGYFILNYAVTAQEFAAVSASQYSFQRLNFSFLHTIPLYKVEKSQPSAKGAPKTVTKNRDGSIELEARLVTSFTPTGNIVPFYLQPTLGGADINGEKYLPSYPDYRFRAPNLMHFRGSIEHSIWGPLGIMFQADTGRVAASRGDLGFQHLSHSFAAGLTLRAGGFPMVQLLFAWGGHEGTHTITAINPSLIGGGSRPSLY